MCLYVVLLDCTIKIYTFVATSKVAALNTVILYDVTVTTKRGGAG